MKKLNLFIEYEKVLLSFDFTKGSNKGYNLSIYSKSNCFSETEYYLIILDSLGEIFTYKWFDTFKDLSEYVLEYYDVDITFIRW